MRGVGKKSLLAFRVRRNIREGGERVVTLQLVFRYDVYLLNIIQVTTNISAVNICHVFPFAVTTALVATLAILVAKLWTRMVPHSITRGPRRFLERLAGVKKRTDTSTRCVPHPPAIIYYCR